MLREDCLLKNGSGTNIAKADELAESDMDMDMSFDRGSVEVAKLTPVALS